MVATIAYMDAFGFVTPSRTVTSGADAALMHDAALSAVDSHLSLLRLGLRGCGEHDGAASVPAAQISISP